MLFRETVTLTNTLHGHIAEFQFVKAGDIQPLGFKGLIAIQ